MSFPNDFVERVEKYGQASVASDNRLPIKGASVKDLENLGFVFIEKADELFNRYKFPPGWTKIPTEHSMYTRLVDDKGVVRAEIFYKAVPYDRRADIKLK